MNFNPYMFELARKARGLTQKELSEYLEVSQGTISKIEQGLLEPDEKVFSEISKKLNYPASFFTQSGRPISPSYKHRRARMSLSAKLRDKIDASNNIKAYVLKELLQSIEIPETKIPELSTDELGSGAEVAKALRSYWQIPKGPIDNLVNLLEKKGIVVVDAEFGTKKFDGVYYPFQDLPHIVFINKDIPGDRQRFTLAHELGHIIMHQVPKNLKEMEDETDEFSAEFCMPEEEIKPFLYNLTIPKLANLKKVWKMSMASILVRANRLGTITNRKYRSLWTEMGKLGYKKEEPPTLNIPREKPQIFEKLVKMHLSELDYSEKELSKTIHLNLEEFKEEFLQKKAVRLLTLDNS